MKLRTYFAAFALTSLTATSAFAAPGGQGRGQTQSRDHRAPVETNVVVRDHRAPAPAPTPTRVPSMRPNLAIPVVTSYSPGYGVAGSSVTIYGENFVAGTKVVYGGIAITPSYLSASKIIFQVPLRAVDATITLDQPGRRGTLTVGSFDVRAPVVVQPQPRGPVWDQEQDLRNSRDSRKAKSLENYRLRWKAAFLASPKTKAELKLHAQRIAKLDRMMRLAKADSRKNAKLIVRINALISKEDKRHDKAMTRLEAQFKLG